jgi:hypothetical protein
MRHKKTNFPAYIKGFDERKGLQIPVHYPDTFLLAPKSDLFHSNIFGKIISAER